MTSSGRDGPVLIGEVLERVLADIWDRTCKQRAARGEAPPPEHLNPNLKGTPMTDQTVHQNPHDVAKAVLRPDLYTELYDWLAETNPGLREHNPGFGVALDKIRERALQALEAPSARLLDHATAAYYRAAAQSLRNADQAKAALLLEHVADDYDGGQQ